MTIRSFKSFVEGDFQGYKVIFISLNNLIKWELCQNGNYDSGNYGHKIQNKNNFPVRDYEIPFWRRCAFVQLLGEKLLVEKRLSGSATVRTASNLYIIFPGYGNLILLRIFLIVFLEL